jgi:calcineurin-like phosphoesterase family protein
MSNLFKKAAVFTDLHLGYKQNSQLFLNDCNRYINWFLDLVQTQNCDIVLFLGDFHDTRNSLNINTMDYSLRILDRLNALRIRVLFIPGNHDLYHKDRRTVTSIRYIEKFKNIELVMDQHTEGDVTFVPWLIGEEHKNMNKIKSRYVMGHFELPQFMMNAMVEMPDHGGLRSDDFGNVGTVFTGHFHKRQRRGNVHYIGNAFPHNYADAWDDARGAMILEWGEEPVYHDWTDGPRYRILTLSQLLDAPDTHLSDKTYARVNIDINISYEEATFIKEEMAKTYNVRELSLIQNRGEVLTENAIGDVKFESVDQIVLSQIQNLDTQHYDTKLLMEIYNSL